jgi:hypothetical protein
MPAYFICASASNLVLNEVLLWAYYIKRDPLAVNKLIKRLFPFISNFNQKHKKCN